MPAGDLLPHVDALIRLLESGQDARGACEWLLTLLDAEPDLGTESLPSVSFASVGDPTAGEEGGTWAPDDGATVGLGLTVGTWAPDATATRTVPTDLRSLCEGLLDGSLAVPDALDALRAWRELRRPPARYVLGEPLGSGGMGDVVRAEDAALERPIAVKVLKRATPRARRNFVAEAKLTARLQHPGIVPVHDVGETPDGRPYFAMMEVRGRSLRQVVAAGELPGRRARLDVFRRVCETVAYAHGQGVLHLDLKPDNVMIGAFGEVFVMDWGLARQVSDGGATLRKVAGTPRYMAPEQATEGHRLDVRADVYSLGAVLYELLADAPAFRGADVTVILGEVRAGRFAPPSAHRADVPRELEELVLRAMALDPATRLATVRDLLDEVEAHLDGRELATVAYTPWERARKWAGRNRGLVRGAVVAGVLGVVGLAAATSIYVARVTEAREEAVRSAAAAHRAERQARRASADALISSGRLQLDVGYLLAGRADFSTAADILRDLGEDPARAELGVAESFMWQDEARTLELDRAVSSMVLADGALWVGGGAGAGRVSLADGAPTWLTEEPTTVVRLGGRVALVRQTDDEVHVLGGDGRLVRRLDVAPPVTVRGGVAVSRLSRRAVALGDGQPIAVDWEQCGDIGWMEGPWARCGPSDQVRILDGPTGQLRYEGMVLEVNPTLGLVLDAGELRPSVFRAQEVRARQWATDDGPVWTTASDIDNVVWAGQDGRIAVRDWFSGNLRLRFDQGPPEEGRATVAVSYDQRRVVTAATRAGKTILRVLQRAGSDADDLYPHAVGASKAGALVAVAGPGRVELRRGGQRHVEPVTGHVRAIRVADDGRVAWVTAEGELGLMAPGQPTRRWQLAGRLIGVAFDVHGRRLAVAGSDGLHIVEPNGEVERVELSQGAAWGVAPMGEGWVVSHPGRQTARAVWVVGGQERAVLDGPGQGYVVAASPEAERVVIATNDGGMLWDGHDAVPLGQTRALGAAWSRYGPVLGDMRSELRFFRDDGELLYRWRTATSPVGIAGYDGGLWVRCLDDLIQLPFAPGRRGEADPAADAWFPQP